MMRYVLISAAVLLILANSVVAQQAEFSYQLVEVDRARASTLVGWSPVGSRFAYFRHTDDDYDGERYRPRRGELHFYDLDTGEDCAYSGAMPDITYENGERVDKNFWLRDGRYLSIQSERVVLLTPCASVEQDITRFLPAPPAEISIVSYSPQRDVLLLRAAQGLYLYSIQYNGFKPIMSDDETFDFNLGKGSVSPDGQRFAYTLSGPGDTFVISIASAQATVLVDEPLPPGEDECCSTPSIPRWLNGDWIAASTRSLGANEHPGDVLVNLNDGRLITASGDYRFVDAYELSDSVVIYLASSSGEYAVMSANNPVPNVVENLQEVRWQPPGVWLQISGNELSARSLMGDFLPLTPIPLGDMRNIAASATRLAAANDHFVSVFDLESGEWIETIVPPGYRNFDVSSYKQGISLWSPDEKSLALTGTQGREVTLFVATLRLLPIPTSTLSG